MIKIFIFRFTYCEVFKKLHLQDNIIVFHAFLIFIRNCSGNQNGWSWRRDSISLLGSTGSYAYLAVKERRCALEVAWKEVVGKTKVIVWNRCPQNG